MDHLLLLSLLLCFLILQCRFSFSLKSLTFLDLGSNLLEGPLPASLCNLKNLQFLLLSDNKLTGEIPHCYSNISSQLTVLDLRKNGFHGKIPINFPEGNQLRNLGLNGNQLEGPIPKSLNRCKSLEVLDLGHNKITDTFPMWLESLPELSVLILKSNQLHGSIGTPKSESSFKKLRILDISYNQFTGSLPAKLIENFQTMRKIDNQTGQVQYMGNGTYYADSITIMMKGLEVEIKRVLTIFTTIDLSGNQFEGKIPHSVGLLRSLKVLNFSHNKLDGWIPSTLGDLSNLESLDLSWNQLEGKIPVELEKLNFLSVLNLSQNHLEGQIPQGGQFDTFTDIYSYLGNKGLCGFPLKRCGEVDGPILPTLFASHHTDFLDVWSGLTWKSVILGYSFGTILGLAIGVLAFSTRKPKWFVIMVEDMSRTSKRPRRRSLRWL